MGKYPAEFGDLLPLAEVRHPYHAVFHIVVSLDPALCLMKGEASETHLLDTDLILWTSSSPSAVLTLSSKPCPSSVLMP